MGFLDASADRERIRLIIFTVISVGWVGLLVFSLVTGAGAAKWVFGLVMTVVWVSLTAILWREHWRRRSAGRVE
jgi:hypothetical protein